MLTRDPRTAVVVTAGATIALIGTFLPWVRSGSRNRTSFQVFDLVDRLGFAPGGPVSWVLRWWAVAPLLLVLTVVGAWIGPASPLARRVASGAGLVVAVVLGGTALALRGAPQKGLLAIGIGPTVTAVGCGIAAIGLLWSTLSSRGWGASAAS